MTKSKAPLSFNMVVWSASSSFKCCLICRSNYLSKDFVLKHLSIFPLVLYTHQSKVYCSDDIGVSRIAAVCPFWIKQPTPFVVSSRLLGSLGSFVDAPCCFVPSGKCTGPVLNGLLRSSSPGPLGCGEGNCWRVGTLGSGMRRVRDKGSPPQGQRPGAEPNVFCANTPTMITSTICTAL
jgi:hypothetical protein